MICEVYDFEPSVTVRNLAGLHVGHLRDDPALVEGVVDELDLDLLDGHRVLVDAEDARRLTRCRAQPPGELREVVGGVQALDAVPPAVPVHQVVPLGDQGPQRTTVVAERDTAIHAARSLDLEGLLRELLVDLFPVLEAQVDGPANRGLAVGVLEEAVRISHERPP